MGCEREREKQGSETGGAGPTGVRVPTLTTVEARWFPGRFTRELTTKPDGRRLFYYRWNGSSEAEEAEDRPCRS